MSSLPILIFLLFIFMTLVVRHLRRLGQLHITEKRSINNLLVILLGWCALSGYLSSKGVYSSPQFISMAPGYWLPYIPVFLVIAIVMLSKSLRDGLRKIVDFTPSYWLTGIHILRIFAIGSIVKASMGLFPEKFAYYMGVPDLIFGLSAILITYLSCLQRLHSNIIIFWHISGALAILTPALSLMHIFMDEALFPELFVFPMVLAPTLVVPMFVMLNLLVAWRLMEKRKQKNVRMTNALDY